MNKLLFVLLTFITFSLSAQIIKPGKYTFNEFINANPHVKLHFIIAGATANDKRCGSPLTEKSSAENDKKTAIDPSDTLGYGPQKEFLRKLALLRAKELLENQESIKANGVNCPDKTTTACLFEGLEGSLYFFSTDERTQKYLIEMGMSESEAKDTIKLLQDINPRHKEIEKEQQELKKKKSRS